MKFPLIIALIIAAISLCLQPCKAAEPDAKNLFTIMEPSVVLITDEEGAGSGVVIGAEGLILTNYHVVNTPLNITVEATVEENGKTSRKTFPNAKVSKVHRTNDLALLKVDAPGVRFKPAKLTKNASDTAAGGTCFALGYPLLPDENKPVITITRGIISAVKRELNGVPYIQLDAAINPGNSGGALINEKGILIGIPTLRFEGSDSIGLASPLLHLKIDQFVDPKDRKGDPVEAKRLAGIADSLYMRDALSLGTDDEAVAVAIYLQRQAIALEPNNPEWSLSLAWMYRRMQKYPLVRAYAENSVRLAPENLRARMLLADALSALKEPAKAAQQRLECLPLLTDQTEIKLRKSLFENLASELSAADDSVRAVYIVSWGLAALGDAPGPAQRLVLQKAARTVPDDYLQKIMAKKSGHSIAEMNDLARNAPKAMPSTAPELPTQTPQMTPAAERITMVTKEVAFEPGWTATLADAPSGVNYNEQKGVIEWKPSAFGSTLEIRVLFLLKNESGEEKFEVHKLQIKGTDKP